MLPAEFSIGELDVRLVEGEEVRNTLDVDFVAGGHHGRYGFIPEGEIWIEEGMSAMDQLATLVHELYELELMDEGMSYDEAHDKANGLERRFREKSSAEGLPR